MRWVIKFIQSETLSQYYVSPNEELSEDINKAHLWHSWDMANTAAEGYNIQYAVQAVKIVEDR